jgi:hypothetical protein
MSVDGHTLMFAGIGSAQCGARVFDWSRWIEGWLNLTIGRGLPGELSRSFEIVEPSASPILESLRAFGYSPATAIADLVDNSIAAHAACIDIAFHWDGERSWVSIADNGDGMTDDELKSAMRLGSRSPLEERKKGDLGRFGLGLKTASFSQARCLTVMTRRSLAQPAVRQWDLDLVQRTNEWRLLSEISDSLSPKMSGILPISGTVVVWESLDRLLGKSLGSTEAASIESFLKVVDDVKAHLELVFHRFLGRPNPLVITVNGRQLVGWDPFLRNLNSMTSGAESIPLAGGTMTVQPFVLPHKSKLTEAEHAAAAGRDGWNASQGYYVYRDSRLLVGGSWLGVGGVKEEHSKLARIQLDIPSSLDHLWQVDVRKASIKAPAAVHSDLRRIARATKKAAQEVYRFRGKQVTGRVASDYVIGWKSIRGRAGASEYQINRKHPLIEDALENGLTSRADVERLLRFVEETVPVTQIGIAVSESLDQTQNAFQLSAPDELFAQLDYLYGRLVSRGRVPSDALDYLSTVEPFIFHPAVLQAYREDLE